MKIVAVGGGEIGRPGFSIETETIDKETIKLTGKKHPKLLFIPTASSDSEGYVKTVKKYFGTRLGCRVDVLYLLKNRPSKHAIRKKILKTDIVYVGGGNTLKMMTVWRRLAVDSLLKEAARSGIVLSGVSAGAACWFRYANSDSRRFTNAKAPLMKVVCLNLLPALCCPHYNREKRRKPSLKKMMKSTPGVAVALDNCAAFEVIGDRYRIITSKSHARAYRVFWSRGTYHTARIPETSKFEPLSGLVRKHTSAR
jgi:dipeptidase E